MFEGAPVSSFVEAEVVAFEKPIVVYFEEADIVLEEA
jgi:hypothetical protein